VSATTKSRYAVGRGRRHSHTPAAAPVPFGRLRVVAFFVGAASLGALSILKYAIGSRP